MIVKNYISRYYDDEEIMKDCNWSRSVLMVIEYDINKYCKPMDDDISYAGRGNSREFSFSEWLVPELGVNNIFYIHDCMYELWLLGISGYSKEFADDLMDNLMEMEGFVIMDDVYHLFVELFG